MPVISVFKRSLKKKEFYFYFFHQASCRKDQFTVSILNLVLTFNYPDLLRIWLTLTGFSVWFFPDN